MDRGAWTLAHPRQVFIPSSLSAATNLIYIMLIINNLLTENRKLKTENGIIGRPVAAIKIDDNDTKEPSNDYYLSLLSVAKNLSC